MEKTKEITTPEYWKNKEIPNNHQKELDQVSQKELSKQLNESEHIIGPEYTVGPIKRNGAIIFYYEQFPELSQWWLSCKLPNASRKIITKVKNNNQYTVEIQKWKQFENKEENWETLKNEKHNTFSINATNKDEFNIKLWKILDKTVWKRWENRKKLPKTGGEVYKLLKEKVKNENTRYEKVKNEDTKYEKKYGVTLKRDKDLIFYIVKKWEWLGIIKQKLQKIPEFSYLKDSAYDIPNKWPNKWGRNTHWFNTPNSSLKPNFYLAIPLKKEKREISDAQFKSYAKKAIEQMKNNQTYKKKMETLIKKVNENEIINIMTAYARSESSDDYKTFSSPIWSAELHRREPWHKTYSFSYFHILMEWFWKTARENLWLTEWDCYDTTNACKLFLWYCFERKADPTYFFDIQNLKDAKRAWGTYNWDAEYWNKLWANIQYCRKK